MFSVNFPDRLLQPTNGGMGLDGVVLGDQMPLVPVVGPSGEIVYCVQTFSPQGAQIPGTLCMDTIQPDLLRMRGQHFAGPAGASEGLLMPHLQNRLITLPSNPINTPNLLNSINTPNLLNSIEIAPTSASNFTQVGHQAGKAIIQNNHEIPDIVGHDQSSMESTTTSTVTLSGLTTLAPTTNENLTGMNVRTNFETAESMNFQPQPSYPLADEQAHFQQKIQEKKYDELGPVEKAIFKQALFTQNKKLTSKQQCDAINSSVKLQSDMHFRGKKHSRGMFEQQILRDGDITNPSSQLLYKHNTIGCSTSRDLITLVNTNKDSLVISGNGEKEIKDEHAKYHQLALPASTSHSKITVLPGIRHHPYKAINGNMTTDKLTMSQDTTQQNNDVTPNEIFGDSQHVTHAKVTLSDGGSKHSVSPAKHFPTTLQPRTCAADVHSVSVSRITAPMLPTKLATPDGSSHESTNDQASNERKVSCENESERNLSIEQTDTKSCEIAQGNENGEDENSKNAEKAETPSAIGETSSKTLKDDDCSDRATTPKQQDSPAPCREVCLPDPLPNYITKVDRPPGRVLKESLHCTTCDVYVNSENQMKQHINSLRHKNTLQGIPIPPKPGRDEKPKLRAEQYRCSVCKVTLNSDIQLSQHLSSQRHKNMLEGKPPKPRWSPYERTHQGLLHSTATLRLPYKTISSQSLLPVPQSTTPITSTAIPAALAGLNGISQSSLAGRYLTPSSTLSAAAHLKQTSFMIHDGGMIQAREIVYVGGPHMQALQGGALPSPLPAVPGIMPGQQPLQLQHVVAAPSTGVDWVTAAGLRLAT